MQKRKYGIIYEESGRNHKKRKGSDKFRERKKEKEKEKENETGKNGKGAKGRGRNSIILVSEAHLLESLCYEAHNHFVPPWLRASWYGGDAEWNTCLLQEIELSLLSQNMECFLGLP